MLTSNTRGKLVSLGRQIKRDPGGSGRSREAHDSEEHASLEHLGDDRESRRLEKASRVLKATPFWITVQRITERGVRKTRGRIEIRPPASPPQSPSPLTPSRVPPSSYPFYPGAEPQAQRQNTPFFLLPPTPDSTPQCLKPGVCLLPHS